jgi:branched-chain amino acid transport system ATP-binding protein
MLAIGRALMARPQLLLLDEPSLGLAPQVIELIFEIIQKINSEGTTILLVEQNAQLALEISSYAYVLETGSILLEGKAEQVLANPKVKEAYLGEMI